LFIANAPQAQNHLTDHMQQHLALHQQHLERHNQLLLKQASHTQHPQVLDARDTTTGAHSTDAAVSSQDVHLHQQQQLQTAQLQAAHQQQVQEHMRMHATHLQAHAHLHQHAHHHTTQHHGHAHAHSHGSQHEQLEASKQPRREIDHA
jgi:hypothetical protein